MKLNICAIGMLIEIVSALAVLAVIMSGCAGPATPLGAIDAISANGVHQGKLSRLASQIEPQPKTSKPSASEQGYSGPRILLFPPRQVLHQKFGLKITIEDLALKNSTDLFTHRLTVPLLVRYNGLDVTQKFLSASKLAQDKDGNITIHNPSLKFKDTKSHLVEIIYLSPDHGARYVKLAEPYCLISDRDSIKRTGHFQVDQQLQKFLTNKSTAFKINPSLLAGLIAQESSFNPSKISWAKALGLTQITPIADEQLLNQKQAPELSSDFTEWPRNPNVEKLPALLLESLIIRGQLNSDNDYRLDPSLSIQAGLAYLKQLIEFWNQPENLKLVHDFSENPLFEKTKLILASYHSGLNRVKKAAQTNGANWIDNAELKEGRKYVGRVLSYCDSFSDFHMEKWN